MYVTLQPLDGKKAAKKITAYFNLHSKSLGAELLFLACIMLVSGVQC